MVCTFCGTENRAEYKFCGTCGVRLERRQAERRTRQTGISATCESCGQVNEPGMKFCGMCGTRVERRLQERRGAGTEPRAVAIANAQLPSPDVAARSTTKVASPPRSEDEVPVGLPRRGEPAIFRNEPANGGNISGPSFLGLNDRPDNNDDVGYLLEDEHSGGGLRKFILLLILAAIIGLVVVQWRSNFKASPKAVPSKADPSTPSPGPQGTNQDPAATGTVQQAAKAIADGLNTVAVSDSSGTPSAKAEPTSLETGGLGPTASSATDEDAPTKKPETEALPNGDTKATEEARIPDYKPSAALLRAQQYIRGAGVPQNCEQGLLYLRAATEKNDPGAAIQMGALYSSGVCVKQDRVMAYRWFNSAHELQPANMWIQKNMDQLWAQMSSQERRLAGY
jgi:Double zinc ribbon